MLGLSLLQSGSVLLRSEKIYAVLAVLLLIFVGVAVYLIFLQRQIAKVEKQVEELTTKK